MAVKNPPQPPARGHAGPRAPALDAFRRLTPLQGQVLLLRLGEGLSIEVVARRLGRKPSQIRAAELRPLAASSPPHPRPFPVPRLS